MKGILLQIKSNDIIWLQSEDGYAHTSVEYSGAILRKSMFIVKKNTIECGQKDRYTINVTLGLCGTMIDIRGRSQLSILMKAYAF